VDGRRRSQITHPPESLPRIPRRPPAPDELSRGWAILVGAGWPLIAVWQIATAPEAANPEAVPSLLDTAVFLAVMTGLVGTIGAAFGRQPRALIWSIGLGVVWVATVITCPLSGHHDAVGWSWSTELAASGALLAASLVGTRRFSRQ
jgi:hypothetical protein